MTTHYSMTSEIYHPDRTHSVEVSFTVEDHDDPSVGYGYIKVISIDHVETDYNELGEPVKATWVTPELIEAQI